jgi:hypothetical protein
MRKKISSLASFALIFVLARPIMLLAQPGALDPSFNPYR